LACIRTVTSGKSKVGEGVKVNVGVMVGVGVSVGVGVIVGVCVGVGVSVGVGVIVAVEVVVGVALGVGVGVAKSPATPLHPDDEADRARQAQKHIRRTIHWLRFIAPTRLPPLPVAF
jgi:hypothetical protein